MRTAIIDLGTNSVRFDIHEIGPGKSIKRIHREKVMVRLGEGVFTDGKLRASAVQRTLEALVRFKKLAVESHAERILAFGTSALREARNRNEFITLIKREAAIDLRVISGKEEAKLIALGVLANETVPRSKFAMVDIGGGSTEISLCRGSQVIESFSFPLGTARLQQLFLKKSPPDPQSISELRLFIRRVLNLSQKPAWQKLPVIFGSSGTIRALHRMNKKLFKQPSIERGGLRKLVNGMATMTTSELLELPKMEPKRVDMILAGAILLEECMDSLGSKLLHRTLFSLRDGLLEEERRLFQQGKDSHLELHFASLLQYAKALGRNEQHLARLVLLSEDLFLKLKGIHQLPGNWKIYLLAATVLKNIGETVSLSGQAQHSYYIVKNADLPPMEAWELEFIARLCLYFERQKIETGYLDFLKSQDQKRAFLKILALLQLVDALDLGPDSRIRLREVKRRNTQLKLVVSSTQLTGIQSLSLRTGVEIFQKVFGLSVKLEKKS